MGRKTRSWFWWALLIAVFLGRNPEIVLPLFLICLFLYISYKGIYIPNGRMSRIEALNAEIVRQGSVLPDIYKGAAFNDLKCEMSCKILEQALICVLAKKKISMHTGTLTRKKAQALYYDDYGVKVVKKWNGELQYFVSNILFPLSFSSVINKELLKKLEQNELLNLGNKQTIKFWVEFVDACLEKVSMTTPLSVEFDNKMTGHEYERFVAELVKDSGWTPTITPGSGDHGADIIAECGESRVAIQCKFFCSAVGNKSVQEAYSAMGFYDCEYGCVVTNSTFTPAARKAASKLNVGLIHHEQLPGYLASINDDF